MSKGNDGTHGDDGGSRDDPNINIESVDESSSESSRSDDETRGSSFRNNTSPSLSAETVQEDSNHTGKASGRDTNRQSSFSFMGGDSDSQPTFSPNASNATNSAASAVVSTEHERQILLLMLLAQVCALHDPTPRTFTVHVLELFERGILDRESIRFLFDYGLVPSLPPPTTSTSPATTPNHAQNRNNTSAFDMQNPTATSKQENQAVIPYRADTNPALRRSQEASAIRSHLERHHTSAPSFPERPKSPKSLNRTKSAPATPPTSSWAAKHFPLSLSRYQREFRQIKLLASGSFGQVFSATRHMDGRSYAVKKVIFSATGYSNESVTQVVREVHCLAQCDHVHCVRYHTSWLEPSWMTGQGSSTSIQQQEQQLLTDMERVVVDHDEKMVVASALSPRKIKRRFSFDSCLSEDDLFSIDDSDYSEWTQDMSSYKNRRRGNDFSSWSPRDDSMLGRRSGNAQKSRKNRSSPTQPQQPTYKYQICLYIQMELCRSTTLADWITSRNATNPPLSKRAGPALRIFRQICSGIAHIHSKSILHRDLKPANIFASLDGGEEHFKIGDFGLSKLLRTANGEQDFIWETNDEETMASPTNRTPSSARSRAIVKRNLPSPPIYGHQLEPQEQDPWLLTAGVGTASYAAPEQIESRAYGPEADVFSMGFILLELFCCFGTQHERFHTFHDCRKGKLPSSIHNEYPRVASAILACCGATPASRPTAQDLLESDLFTQKQKDNGSKKADEQARDVVPGLKRQIEEKDLELQNQQLVIAEKDKIIDDLRRQLQQFKGSGLQPTVAPMPPLRDVGRTAASSYSDDEDY